MDSIGGMLNPMGKWPKHNRKMNLYWFYWKKLMVIMGIVSGTIMGIILVLMETIMVSTGM